MQKFKTSNRTQNEKFIWVAMLSIIIRNYFTQLKILIVSNCVLLIFRSVRGRKKVDAGNAVGGSNLVSMNTGDVSIGYSPPPRGTDDTAESDTSSVASSMEKLHEEVSLFPEVWPGKVCVFCNLGERSMLGQGELLRLEISEGFDPVAAAKGLTVIRKGESVCASDKCQKPGGLFARRQKGSGKMKYDKIPFD